MQGPRSPFLRLSPPSAAAPSGENSGEGVRSWGSAWKARQKDKMAELHKTRWIVVKCLGESLGWVGPGVNH